jgi:hypothetical protein
MLCSPSPRICACMKSPRCEAWASKPFAMTAISSSGKGWPVWCRSRPQAALAHGPKRNARSWPRSSKLVHKTRSIPRAAGIHR